MDVNFNKELLILSQYTYDDENTHFPFNWRKIKSYNDRNGFQAFLYKNNDNNIVLSFRGTEIQKLKNAEVFKDLYSDAQLALEILPLQYSSANALYQEIKKGYPNFEITVTGHSLGGSLAQLVSAANDCPAVTFNAYGTGNIIRNMGISDLDSLNIVNYGNPKDSTFTFNIENQPGRTFAINTNLNPDKKYYAEKGYKAHKIEHNLEYMTNLDNAVEIDTKSFDIDKTPILKAGISYDEPFTKEDIAKMTNQEFEKNETEIMSQAKEGKIKNKKIDYDKFKNPLTGRKKVYTLEEISKMSNDEYEQNELEIMAQIKEIGLPSKKEVYKNASSNNANSKWVTIDGNHILIEK